MADSPSIIFMEQLPTKEDTSGILLSPTKARAHARTQTDWSITQSFLTQLFHPHSIPIFERNDSTLLALLSLSAAVSATNERRNLIHAAQKEELERLRLHRQQQQQQQQEDEEEEEKRGEWYHEEYGDRNIQTKIQTQIQQSLNPSTQKHLNEIATAWALLLLPPPSLSCSSSTTTTTTIAPALETAQEILSLSLALSTTSNNLTHLQRTLRDTHLAASITTAQSQISTLSSSSSTATATATPPSQQQQQDDDEDSFLADQTSHYTRTTKFLTAKLAEYKDRLALLTEKTSSSPLPSSLSSLSSLSIMAKKNPGIGGNTRSNNNNNNNNADNNADNTLNVVQDMNIQAIISLEKEILARRDRVNRLEERLTAYNNVPVDLDGARSVYGELVQELRDWERKREGLFGGLVD